MSHRKRALQETADLLARDLLAVIVHHGDTTFELPFDVAGVCARTCHGLRGGRR